MKKIIIINVLLVLAIMGVKAQSYNMVIKLATGEVVSYPADEVMEVTFSEVTDPITEEFNILDEEHVKDAVLRQYIVDNLANGSDTYTNVQAAAYTGEINLSGKKLFYADGLEYFTALTGLNVNGTSVATLDLTANKSLLALDCGNCRYLTELNVEGLDQLEKFVISSSSGLAKYDLSVLPETIKELGVNSLSYEELDFRGFPNIETVSCTLNKLKELNLAGISTLKSLACSSNSGLATLNLSGCENLEILVSSYCQELTNLNIEGCHAITTLYIQNTGITTLDMSGFKSSLRELNVSNNNFQLPSLKGFSALEYLEMQENGITESPDFSDCSALQELRCESNNFPVLDLSACTQLKSLQCYSIPELTTVKLAESLPNLTLLNLSSVESLTSFEWGDAPSVNNIMLYLTGLKRLDLSRINHDCRSVYLGNNNMKEIKVWSEFDLDNPPSSFYKDVWTAPDDKSVYVYEFTDASR